MRNIPEQEVCLGDLATSYIDIEDYPGFVILEGQCFEVDLVLYAHAGYHWFDSDSLFGALNLTEPA